MVLKLSEIVKLGRDRGIVGPMILVVLKGSTGFVVLGIDIERPVEPMILVILTELKEIVGVVGEIDVRLNTDGVRTDPVDRMIDEKLVRLAGVGNVGEPETEFEMFNEVGIERLGTETLGILEIGVEMFSKVGIERLGTETPGVEGMGILEIGVERLNERVAETEKPELGRVGVGRGIELLRESDVVEMEMVLGSVRLVKGELTARELLGMEGIEMTVEGIEGVPTTVSVVTPDKRLFLYSTIVWRALAVRVRVCILYIS